MNNNNFKRVKLTILIDDFNGAEPNFKKSFGFAALIEINNKKILFDTGSNSEPLLYNLKVLGVSATSLDAVILSHNHNDHTDGIIGILRENNKIPVYVNKDWDVPVSYQGLTIPKKNLIYNEKARECREISESLYLTNSYFSSDYGKIYEHACYIKTHDSYILLCGCCHPGLNAFLNDRKELDIYLDKDLHLIGGMHSFKFSEDQAEKLFPLVKSIILCHCTMNSTDFNRHFKKKCGSGILGKTLSF